MSTPDNAVTDTGDVDHGEKKLPNIPGVSVPTPRPLSSPWYPARHPHSPRHQSAGVGADRPPGRDDMCRRRGAGSGERGMIDWRVGRDRGVGLLHESLWQKGISHDCRFLCYPTWCW